MGDDDEKERKRLEKEKRRQEFLATQSKNVEPKKKLTKEERRTLQEQQKAAKKKLISASSTTSSIQTISSGMPKQSVPPKQAVEKKAQRKGNLMRTTAQKTVELFSHLPQYEREASISLKVTSQTKVHPTIVTLGLKYHENAICGSTARAVAMLLAFKEVIATYKTPESEVLRRDLDRHLKPMIQFLINCRPHSITMGNAIKHVRHAISTIPHDWSEAASKDSLLQTIDNYIQTRIIMAEEQIVRTVLEKISDGDTILTFGRSHVVEQALIQAHLEGRTFKVVVVNSRPSNEGEYLVEQLAKRGINCVFILLTSISYVMESVTKVVLGASALMSNGTMLGRVGTAAVAMVAKAFNKPVLVCAARHKFTEKVQLDSITTNELRDPDELILPRGEKRREYLYEWRDMPNMLLLNLNYDLTPPEFMTMIITEFGMIPPSSVPVIVREKE